MKQLRKTFSSIPYWVWCLIASVLAVVLRIALFQFPGLDDEWWTSWASQAVKTGVGSLYLLEQGQYFPANYPPLFLYCLQLFGSIEKATNGFIDVLTQVHVIVTLGDVLVAWLLFALVRHEFGVKRALGAATLWMVNLVAIYESGLWGQNDVQVSVWTLATILLLQRKKPYLAAIAVTVGLLTKVQGIVVVPLLIAWVVVRKEWTLRQWLSAIFASVATVGLAIVPLGSWEVVQAMVKSAYLGSAGYYPFLSLNAYNLWWLRVSDPTNFGASLDSVPLLGPLTALHIGLLLFGVLYLGILVLLVMKAKKMGVYTLAGFCALGVFAFFLFTTQMHERYNYQYFALSLLAIVPFVGRVRRWLLAGWWAMVVLTTLNLSMVWSATAWMRQHIGPISHTVAWLLLLLFCLQYSLLWVWQLHGNVPALSKLFLRKGKHGTIQIYGKS